MKLLLNGDPQELSDGTTVAELVAQRLPSPNGVAVAVDEELVPRSQWASRILSDGERVEVLSAVQGG